MAKLQDAKNAATPEKVEQPKFSFYPIDETHATDSLSNLIELKNVPIKYAEYAMRDLNALNVANLKVAIEAQTTLPAIEVVPSTYGQVIVDGYHRFAAYCQILREAIDAAYTDDSQEVRDEKYLQGMVDFQVPVMELAFETENGMLEYAFRANLKHGLAASPESRSRYALWLIDTAQERGEVIGVREAARRALVSHVAVINMRKRLEKKMKMNDDIVNQLSESDKALIAEVDAESLANESTSVDATDRAIQSVIRAVAQFAKLDYQSSDVETFAQDAIGKIYKEDIVSMGALLNSMLKVVGNRPLPEVKEAKQPKEKESKADRQLRVARAKLAQLEAASTKSVEE